jgi:hypothetical protein
MILHSLRHRIERLERQLGGDAIVLHMQDGSTLQLCGSARHYHRLTALLDSKEDSSPLHGQLQMIRDCIAIDEGGRHVYELLACLLRGAANTEVEEDG